MKSIECDNYPKNTLGVSNIEERRRKGRLRSKESRDRRKVYISNLEERIKFLENENFRLQSIILKYRRENFENIDKGYKSFIEESIEHKRKVYSQFMDLETLEIKKAPKVSLAENFQK